MHNIPSLLTPQADAECHVHQCSIIFEGSAQWEASQEERPYVYDVTEYAHW